MSACAPTVPPSTDPTPSGRDEKGRFTAGNPGGPGNPFARQVAALRQALVNTVTVQDMVEVAHALMLQAKCGNVAAAKLLLEYTLGKPAKAQDPDGLAVHEWETFKEQAPLILDLPGLLKAPDPELTLNLLRVGRPGATRDWEHRIHQAARQAERIAQRRAARAAQRGRPSTNGVNGSKPETPPSPNGSNGTSNREHAVSQRPAQDAPRPSANGGNGQVPQAVHVEGLTR